MARAPLEGAIADLTAEVGAATGFDFNAVLVNGYRDGQDAMGWHRDNEREIDTSCIASLSLVRAAPSRSETDARRRW